MGLAQVKAASAAVLLLLAPGAAQARVDAQDLAQLSFRQHPGAQLPLNAEVRDDAGRPVSLASEFDGKPTVFILEYLRCQSLCSLVLSGATNALSSAHLVPRRDFSLVAVSIDPRDTTQDAAASRAMYSRRFANPRSAAAGIHFLTGSPDEVSKIAGVVGFSYRFDRATNQFAHPAGFVVATPNGRISRYMLGLNPDPATLREALAEAGQGTVDPPAHPLLLLCFGYDPDEGTVAALAMRLVRWVSLAVLLGSALLIGFLSMRRRNA